MKSRQEKRLRKQFPMSPVALVACLCILFSCSEPRKKSPVHVVIAIAEPGYHTAETLPDLAKKIWNKERGYEVTIIVGDPAKHNLVGLPKALQSADVLVTSVRRQALPAAQLTALRNYLAAGKPLLAIRTSSHGFTALGKGPAGNKEWPEFGAEVIGADFKKHAGHKEKAVFTAAKGAAGNPLLDGVDLPFSSGGGIYFSGPMKDSVEPLLMGTIPGMPPEPVAWRNVYGPNRAKIFYTSLGQEEEFALPSFQKLLENAMDWLLERR